MIKISRFWMACVFQWTDVWRHFVWYMMKLARYVEHETENSTIEPLDKLDRLFTRRWEITIWSEALRYVGIINTLHYALLVESSR